MAFTPKLGRKVEPQAAQAPAMPPAAPSFVPKLGRQVQAATEQPQHAQNAPQPAPEPQAEGWKPTFGRIFNWTADRSKDFLQGLQDVGVGAVKGAASTALNLSQMGSDALNAGYDATIGKLTGTKGQQTDEFTKELKQDYATPTNTAQKVGFYGEQIAENFIPATKVAKAGALSKVSSLTSKAPKAIQWGANLLTRMGVEGAEGAAMAAAQGGDVSDAAGISAAIPFLGDVMKGAGFVSRKLAQVVSSATSGVPTEALEYAFQNPTAVRGAIKEMSKDPEMGVQKLVQTAEDAFDSLKEARDVGYRTSMETIQKKTMQMKNGQLYIKMPVSAQDVKEGINQSKLGQEIWKPVNVSTKGVKDVMTRTLGEFDVVKGKAGLDFSTSRLEPHQDKIEKIRNMVYNWQDVSPLGLNKLAQKIGDYRITGPGMTADKQFNAFIQSTKKNISGYIGDKAGPEIGSMNKEYAVASEFLDDLKDSLKLGKDKPEQVARKLMNTFNDKSVWYRGLVQELGEKTARDMRADIAGMLMSSWTPQGLGKYVTGAILGSATGVVPALAAASPKLSGLASTAAGSIAKSKTAKKVGELVEPLGRAIGVQSTRE